MLELKSQPSPPYFLSYAVTESHTSTFSASFGAMDGEETSANRILDIDLRVGSHNLDNTRSIRGVAFEMGRGMRSQELPMGDDERSLRTLVWIATDRAYKAAVERLGKVKTNLQVKVREEDTSADQSIEKATTFIQPFNLVTFDTSAWRDRVRRLSAVCVGHPELYTGKVTLQFDQVVKFFVNSEGTMLQHVEPIVKMFVIVKTKAEDGMSLPLYRSYSAHTLDRLPSEESIRLELESMTKQAVLLRTAPLAETYSGPAILSGRSAGVFFHEIFGHRAEGHRQKDANSSQTFKAFLGKKILPSFIDVVFDPTKKTLGNVDIVGAFAFDDEGIPAQRVVAVKDGVFQNFLMSRSPIEGFPKSNGHGRRQPGLRPVSRQSNLIVEAKTTVPYDSLRALLRKECIKQNKEYGLVFDDIQGGFTFTGRTVPNAFNVQPLVVYKVFADGRPDELVRGVDLIGTPLTTFNNIVTAADDIGIFNGVCGAESGGVPVSASSPSLLVSTIEVQKKQKSQAKPPLLADPSTTLGGGQ
ncbi:MAG: metallopeptidase TldD-related protein [bacterium]|nr:metallopeptidase TldD-related protein [bacterium]